jgi:predicted AAA+ superfamily ATPase
VLKATFICFTLPPHFANFGKRLIKTPKLYFYDTGLAAMLLKMSSVEILSHHPLKGHIFENWMIAELMKTYENNGEEPPLYFWRDTKGNEVDVVIDQGKRLYPIEIKSSMTFHSQFLKGCDYLNKLQGIPSPASDLGKCIYAGEKSFDFQGYHVISLRKLDVVKN